jgi:parvulin-like peptidyl-prolyl isomerase
MASKDACSERRYRTMWPAIMAATIPGIGIVAISVAGQLGGGPDSAVAQAPVRNRPPSRGRSVPGRTGNAPPAARTANATRTPAAASGTSARKTMAVVNSEELTRRQLADECIRRYGKDVLESMINKHLIWQECQQRGIAITEGDVDAEIQRMASKFGLAVDRWLTMLERERDISPSKYRGDIIWPTLALRMLASKEIVVDKEQLKRAFDAEYGPKVKVRLISLSTQRAAENVHKQALSDPSNFGDLAKEYSEDPSSAAARGLIPPIRKNVEGYEELEQVAFSLREGEISRIVKVVNQYLILKCEGHIAENYISSERIKRVEAQLHDQLRDKKLRAAASEIFQRLQANAQVANCLEDPQARNRYRGAAANINGQTITMLKLSEECVLRHGKDVLEGEINRMLLLQELQRRRKIVTNDAINQEIARAAVAYGHVDQHDRPDVDSWLKSVTESDDVTVDLYIHDAVWPSVALKLLVTDTVSVSREDLERGFEANYGERVEVLTIVLSNQRTANTVWEMARNNPTDQFFGELAEQYSIEPVSKANYGKIPPIRRFGGQPVIEEEAFGLDPGELSGIVSVADKYIILRCLGRTKPVVQDFAAVESELRKDIHEKKLRLAMAEEFDRLRESAQIDNFLASSSQPGKSRSQATSAPQGPRATR